MKVLMIAPYSPLSNMGGAEVAARRLADGLTQEGGCEVIQLAAVSDDVRAGSPVSLLGDGTFVVEGGYSDRLRFISRRSAWASRSLGEWLAQLRPDVVHFHHFLGVGSDLIPLVRRVLPESRMVYTAHEFLLLCARDGKMVRSSGRLCEAPSSVDCSTCVGAPSVDIMLRDDYFRRIAGSFDALISPSEFVAGRLRAWLGDQPVDVIPNCPPPHEPRPPRPLGPGEGRNRLGFFGQVIPQKGLHVLLDAAAEAGRLSMTPIDVLVFGTRPDMEYWDQEIEPRLRGLADGRVRASYQGVFRNEDVAEVMELVDWVAVPSTWWENAPTVMIEAMAVGRPLLAGNIGGMRETVELTGAGLTVPVGSVPRWARAIADVTAPSGVDEWTRLHECARLPWGATDIVRRHLDLYESRL